MGLTGKIANTHGVSKRQWAKWSPGQRLMFNYLYQSMASEELYKHKPYSLSPEHWNVTRWNAAFTAACHYGTIRKMEERLT